MSMHRNAPVAVTLLYERNLRSLERKQVEIGMLISRATELSAKIEQQLEDTRDLLCEVKKELIKDL